MASQLSPLSLDNILQAKALGDPGQPFMVYSLAGNLHKLFYFLSVYRQYNVMNNQSMSFGYSQAFKANDGRYRVTVLDVPYVTATVLAKAVVGNTLVVNLTDPTYDAFRLKDVVSTDVNLDVKGQVIIAGPGVITLEPTEGATIAQLNAAIQPNSFIRVMYDTSGNRQSAGKTRLDQVPDERFNLVSTTRESTNWSMRDNTASFVRWSEKDGMWYDGRIDRMLERFLFQLQVKMLYSGRDRRVATIEGEQDSNGGLDWCIKNRNGVYLPLSSPLTRAQFENWLAEIRNRKTRGTTERKTLVMGRDAYNRIAGFADDYIRFSGQYNTFGGAEVQGTNIPIYAVNGEEYNLIILDFLSDPKYSPTLSTIPGINSRVRSNDIYLLDLDPIASGNNMGDLPAIQMIHWGENGSSPFYSGYIQGMGQGNEVTNEQIIAASQNQIVTDIETKSFHIMTMMGIDMPVAEFSGKIELIA